MDRVLLIRVTAPAVAIGLLLLGTCAAGVAYINRLQSNLTKILSQNVASLQAAQELQIRVRQLRYHNVLYFLDPTPGRLDPIKGLPGIQKSPGALGLGDHDRSNATWCGC